MVGPGGNGEGDAGFQLAACRDREGLDENTAGLRLGDEHGVAPLDDGHRLIGGPDFGDRAVGGFLRLTVHPERDAADKSTRRQGDAAAGFLGIFCSVIERQGPLAPRQPGRLLAVPIHPALRQTETADVSSDLGAAAIIIAAGIPLRIEDGMNPRTGPGRAGHRTEGAARHAVIQFPAGAGKQLCFHAISGTGPAHPLGHPGDGAFIQGAAHLEAERSGITSSEQGIL